MPTTLYPLLHLFLLLLLHIVPADYSHGVLFAYSLPTTVWLLLLTDYSIPNTPYRILTNRYFLLPILHLHSLLLPHIHRVRPVKYTLTRPLPYFYFYVYSVPTTSCRLLPANYSTPNSYPVSLPLHDPSIKFVSIKNWCFLQVFWWFCLDSYGRFDIQIFWKMLFFLLSA